MNQSYEQQYAHYDLQSKSRTKFINKVYSLLSVQLGITAAFVCLNIYSNAFASLQESSTLLWILALIATFATLIPLSFSPQLGKTYPTNMIMLGIFTLGQSYLVSSITSMYEPQSVLMCAIATAAATFGITFYAMTTKKDFTQIIHLVGAVFSSIFWIFMFLSIFNVFFFRSSLLVNLQAFVFALIYCVYIAIDTQLILGGKNKQLTLDNYVMGAMLLYIDIIGLFLKLLQLLGDKKKK